jgi:3-deoxy-D-manno-octulosonic-acid transferase
VRPDLIVLAEAELWPNFLFAAKAMNIPVAVINGRLSPRTANRYRRLRWLAWPMLRCVDLFAVQTEEYAEHFRRLGVSADEVHVTGSVKFDGVRLERDRDVESMAQLLGIQPDERVWVCGSTQAPEEEIALDIYQRAKGIFPALRLILVPRQRERFDEVARLLQARGVPFLRRSEINHPVIPSSRHPVILLDTIGELSAVWGLAAVAFVGGSLDGRRGGQNMIEPAAFGAAVCFGPHVWNFRDIAENLVKCGGAVRVRDAAELETAVRRFLADADERRRSGAAARQFVLAQQGATRLTMDALDALLRQRPVPLAA